ncbi:MAG: glycosyltransferase [Bacteroidetes bacterium]|nr:glycosyltransferase [Bacteroidota bacterium]
MKPLGFIIITYNRPSDTLELLKNIATLDKANDLLEEIIVVNNASSENYDEVESYIKRNKDLPFYYYASPENKGVSGGRNYAIKKSNAPILVFLDDDAVFKNKDALINILNAFNQDNQAGILAFKVYYYDTLEMQKNAFPHKQFIKKKDLPHFDTYYYPGCAHAIRKEVFDKINYYPEDFFYGMEEYDLSYRAIDSGYTIEYTGTVQVLHKESPLGRMPSEEKIRSMWVNKSKVSWKYLPRIYYFTTKWMWSFEYLQKTKFNLKGWFKGWGQIKRIPSTEIRKVISPRSIDYLKKVNARLWY